MHILISTIHDDLHAHTVAAVLRQRGHEVTLLHHADFPTRQKFSLALDAGKAALELSGAGMAAIDPRCFDVVWNRRHSTPTPEANVAPDDQRFVARELREASRTLWQSTGATAFWINPEPALALAQNKAAQLIKARELGMAIPATLIGNDPDAIRAFLVRHQDNTIYKPFTPGDWMEQGELHMLYTAKVDASMLPNDALLQACPGIYQERVAKHYEVRATFMGNSYAAIRIDSQQTANGQLDWRRAQESETMPASVVDLPLHVRARCRRLMQGLDIVFGCFDFIVTPEGEWVFLEVNEAGQFLFLESWCPELPTLDMFCAFVESRDPEFVYAVPATPARFDAVVVDAEVTESIKVAREIHIGPEPRWLSATPQSEPA
jgi:hypothetical protein